MTRDDILRMAREAGATKVDAADPQCWIGAIAFDVEELERFAALVAAAELRRLHAENERLHQINQSHEMKLSVRGYEIQIADLEAQRDALLEALKVVIDHAEFWINHRQERRMSEQEFKVWLAIGHESNAMLNARAAIKAVEETK